VERRLEKTKGVHWNQLKQRGGAVSRPVSEVTIQQWKDMLQLCAKSHAFQA